MYRDLRLRRKNLAIIAVAVLGLAIAAAGTTIALAATTAVR
ncbi:MAG: hypothetical protein QOE61_2699 [Micromonosporaceae bacterium]|nr:hypothetical protein [Micromonosporaceae bacterium]